MKSTLIAATLFATALASPYYVYSTEIDTVTQTVTASPAAVTDGGAKAWRGGWWSESGWGHGASSDNAMTTTTVEAPAPAATTEAPAAPPPPPPTTEVAPQPHSPAPAPASSSWASAPAPSAAPASSYAQAILDQHNNHRSNSSAPPLTWDDNMASIAQQIAASCVYAHNTAAGGGGYGQNIGAGATGEAVPALITNEMYNNEIGYYPTPYGQANPDMGNFEKWGHYSQIVWKSTTSVGCFTQYCPGGLANTGSDVPPYFTVCNYSPPGNFGGEYGANVLQPGSMAAVNV